jgi:type III restriction enzyme
MPRAKKAAPASQALIDYQQVLDTGVCVPAIRAEVEQWLASGDYPGVTATTRTLLHHWFQTDHRLSDRRTFAYHASQRRAVETLVYLYEVAGISSQKQMYERYVQAGQNPRMPGRDPYPRLCVKMATGSGKTKVMSLTIAWQYFNAVLEHENPVASTFLIIAPNVIVFERLKRDFRNGAIFRSDPVIPRSLEVHWDFECYVRGDGERAHSEGALFLTNVQQLYERAPKTTTPDPMAGVLGPDPKAHPGGGDDFAGRIAKRGGPVCVLNDEAHHTHDPGNEWMNAIGRLDQSASVGLQLDFTATPRFTNGVIFPWTAYDYPLRNAIDDGIVKRPLKGVAHFEEQPSEHAPTRYAGYLTAGVERWKEYREQLAATGKRPILFLMLNKTSEADEVAAWLKTKYPDDFAGEKTLTIHTDNTGEVSQKDMEAARKFVDGVDQSGVNAVVSVLMLREGWDVENVTVVVGLRPFSAKSNILPEQAIGRGLRLMFRGRSANAFTERVDIIGNKAFLDFVEDLEKLEGIKLDTFDLGKERLTILTIVPVPGRELFDIGIPELSRALARRQDLGDVIAALDLATVAFAPLRPATASLGERMRFEGFDILTREKEIDREYAYPEVQTPQEVIAYYAEEIARRLKAPGHFAAIAVRLREFFNTRAFGGEVDLEQPGYLQAMASRPATAATVDAFVSALQPHLIERQTPQVMTPARSLYTTPPFPWSRPVYQAEKSIFNYQACDNEFERTFARWLDKADDCRAMAKLPRDFGFAIEYADAAGNLRLYYPDFVAVGTDGAHWLIETKGQEDLNVGLKDRAAELWCRNATELGVGSWRYVKVRQKDFEGSEPRRLAELERIGQARL